MSNWNMAFKKGKVGERIVAKKMIEKGFIPYLPISGPHPFDSLCASKDKKDIVIVEVKAFQHRRKHPDQGITVKHYQEYCDMRDKHNILIFLYFVDEKMRQIYGAELSKLEEKKKIYYVNKYFPYGHTSEYPHTETDYRGPYGSARDVIYFPLKNMKTLAKLNKEEVAELKKYTQSKYK